ATVDSLQSQLILVGCARLQVEADGCRFIGTESRFAGLDNRN
ncbi:hypothetical protein PSYMO_35450, partial [Pseudomonas amygdali pv. mori str. 301020]